MTRTVRFSELGDPDVLRISEGPGAEHVFDAVAGSGVADLARATAAGGVITIHRLLSASRRSSRPRRCRISGCGAIRSSR